MWATVLNSVINIGTYIANGNSWPPPKANPIWKLDANFPESTEAEAFWSDVLAGTFGECNRLECYRNSMLFGKFLGRGAQGSKPPDIGIEDGAIEVKGGELGQLNDSPLTSVLYDDDPKIPKLFQQRGNWKNHKMKMWYAFSDPIYHHILLDGSLIAPDWREYNYFLTAIRTMQNPEYAGALVNFLDNIPNKPEKVYKAIDACRIIQGFNSQPTNEIARFLNFGNSLQYLRLRPMFGISQKQFKPVLKTILSPVSECRFVLLMNAVDYPLYSIEQRNAIEQLQVANILDMASSSSIIEGISSKIIWVK